MKLYLSILLLSLSICANLAVSQTLPELEKPAVARHWSHSLKPASILAQHSGYAGFAAMGVGYTSARGAYGFDLLYGYTPKIYAGQSVHSLTIKNLWNMFTFDIGPDFQGRPYAGLNLIYSPDSDLFIMLPEQYPAYYYTPTAIRPALVAGFAVKWLRGGEIALEYALIDSELAYYRDRHRIDPNEIGSLGISYRWYL